ncbi:MAG: NYN domain-containing protein [Roseiflexaceae bacterium]|nr:NYN domain-containing protein [Roseiflexaceae bacterium]
MPLLIDGHNLIAQMPGLRLSDVDDEAQLVMILRRYAAQRRGRAIVVVFDQGAYGHPQHLDGYGVTCIFARSPQDADAQLIRRIAAITNPREWAVVTADRQVAQAAAARGMRVINSRTFAQTLATLESPPRRSANSEKPERTPGQSEVEEWLRLFGEEEGDDHQ